MLYPKVVLSLVKHSLSESFVYWLKTEFVLLYIVVLVTGSDDGEPSVGKVVLWLTVHPAIANSIIPLVKENKRVFPNSFLKLLNRFFIGGKPLLLNINSLKIFPKFYLAICGVNYHFIGRVI
jgi:hypothetical protein